MTQELTDSQFALLCSVGERDPSKLTPDQQREFDALVAAGFIAAKPGSAVSAFALTPKGSHYVSERGAGLNEA